MTEEQTVLVVEALKLYGGELIKLMKKAEKIGRVKEQTSLKQTLLQVEQLRGNLS